MLTWNLKKIRELKFLFYFINNYVDAESITDLVKLNQFLPMTQLSQKMLLPFKSDQKVIISILLPSFSLNPWYIWYVD